VKLSYSSLAFPGIRSGSLCAGRDGLEIEKGRAFDRRFGARHARGSERLAQDQEILLAEITVTSRLDATQCERAETDTREALHLEAKLAKHDADLPLEALVEYDLNLVGGGVTHRLHAGDGTLDPSSLSQGNAVLLHERLVQNHLILFLHSLGRVHEVLGEDAVIGEQQESLALLVETTYMKEMTHIGGEEVKDRSLGMLVAAGRGVPCGLVKKNGAWSEGVNDASAHPDIILFLYTGGEIACDGAVHRDASLENQFFAGAAGSKACSRQKTIQAHTCLSRFAPCTGGAVNLAPGRG